MFFAGDKKAFKFVCKFLSASTLWYNRQCMVMPRKWFCCIFYISKEILVFVFLPDIGSDISGEIDLFALDIMDANILPLTR